MFILPSRGRPDNVARLIEAWHETAATAMEYKWRVRLDEDDLTLDAYYRLPWPKCWNVIIGKRISPCEAFNEAFGKCPDAGFYGLMGDDIMPRTACWDAILVSEASGWNVAYGDDLINGEAHGTHLVVGGELIRALGWVSLPGVKRLYCDTALNHIGRSLGVLRYRPDVILEHLHFSNRKAPMDETYRKPEKREDRRIFEAWRRDPATEATLERIASARLAASCKS